MTRADPPDVGRVAGGDAVVDDVGVERRQVQHAAVCTACSTTTAASHAIADQIGPAAVGSARGSSSSAVSRATSTPCSTTTRSLSGRGSVAGESPGCAPAIVRPGAPGRSRAAGAASRLVGLEQPASALDAGRGDRRRGRGGLPMPPAVMSCPDRRDPLLQQIGPLTEALARSGSVAVDLGSRCLLRTCVGSSAASTTGRRRALLVGEDTEDRALGDPCGLGDLAGGQTRLPCSQQQRHGGRDQLRAPLLGGQGRRPTTGATGVVMRRSYLSERSLR